MYSQMYILHLKWLQCLIDYYDKELTTSSGNLFKLTVLNFLTPVNLIFDSSK